MKLSLIDISKPHKLRANGDPEPEALRQIADAMERLHGMGVQYDLEACGWSSGDKSPCAMPVTPPGAFALAAGLECGDEPASADATISIPALSRHIGFADGEEFERWAHENADIWGNEEGNGMFCIDRAYLDDIAPNTPCDMPMYITLADIARHYRAVAGRIEALRG